MKKITYEQACRSLKKGKSIKCRINLKETLLIKTKEDLDAKKMLYEEGIQGFELYENKESVRLPKGTEKLTIDEAVKEIAEGKNVYCKIEKHEEEIVSIPELTSKCRSLMIRGQEPVIYKYVS